MKRQSFSSVPALAAMSMKTLPKVSSRALLAASLLSGFFAQAQANQTVDQATNKNASATTSSTLNKVKRPVLFAGEVQASDSIPIVVPTSNVSPVTLRYYVPEGSRVKAGDVVLRVDAQGNTDLERVELEMTQAQQLNAREVAELDVRQIEAERALLMAKAALAKAKVDAALPKAQIAALDYDKYQGELDRAKKDLDVKEKALEIAKEAIKRKIEDGALALKKSQIQVAFSKAQIAQSEVRAPKDGVIIHGYDRWSGKRLDEGGMGHIGSIAGHIMGSGQLRIVAYVLESDRSFIKQGQTVTVRFDAIPSAMVKGTVESIAGAPEAKAAWGSGRYFKTDIRLNEASNLPLQHGMSAAIEAVDTTTVNNSGGANVADQKKSATKPAPSQITLEGDVLSRQSYAIAPPSIQQVWEYNLVMLAAEGKQVKEGEPVAIFEANEVGTRLDTHRSSLKEKQRAMDKLKLDQAEALRAADLAVSEAKSNAEKAERKASLPRELVKRIDYDKLVVERELFGQLAQLAVRQREAQKRAKEQEMLGMKTEVAQLQRNIAVLEKGVKGLTVTAPRLGTVVHMSNFSGEKFAVGSRVFMSIAVANLADPDKLYVAAKVPEAQVGLIKLGQMAKVTVPGANTIVNAKITAMGPVFHGKSSNQPIVVRDIEMEFESLPKGVKPGTAVQVQLETESSANGNSAVASSSTANGVKK